MRVKLYLLLCFFFLGSCSKLNLAVYWADTFLLSQIDDYFTLNSDQKAEIKKDLQEKILEIRKFDFPKLALSFESMATELEKEKVEEKFIATARESLRTQLIDMGKRFEPLAQKLMAWESEKNFRRFDQTFSEKQQERWEKISTEAKREKEARRRLERIIDRTVEEFTETQEKDLRQVLIANPLVAEWENRNYVFRKFQLARENSEERKKFVKSFFDNWEILQSSEYLTARNSYQKKFEEFLQNLVRNLTQIQKRNVVKNFRSLANEIRSLSVTP